MGKDIIDILKEIDKKLEILIKQQNVKIVNLADDNINKTILKVISKNKTKVREGLK